MHFRLRYNKWAFRELAKEFRRASWGIAAIAASTQFVGGNVVSLIVAAISWVALQSAALLIELVGSDGEEDSNVG